MPAPSLEIIQRLSVFGVAMPAPTFAKSLVLVYGAILAPSARTVSAALRVMGLADLETFVNYHRVLNRDCWSPWVLSHLLLQLIIRLCVPDGAALVLVVDETLERRAGRQIKYKGRFRDAVRSTVHQVVLSLGFVGAVARFWSVSHGVPVYGPYHSWWCRSCPPKPAPNSANAIAPA